MWFEIDANKGLVFELGANMGPMVNTWENPSYVIAWSATPLFAVRNSYSVDNLGVFATSKKEWCGWGGKDFVKKILEHTSG